MAGFRFLEGSDHGLHLVFDIFLDQLKMVTLKFFFHFTINALINFERTQVKKIPAVLFVLFPFLKDLCFQHTISISAFSMTAPQLSSSNEVQEFVPYR